MSASPFQSLRRDVDRMLRTFGLSQHDVERTHLDDNALGGHDGAHAPHESPLRELLHGDAEQRDQAAVSVLRPEGGDEQGGRRFLSLDSMPVVRLAQRTQGDVARRLEEPEAVLREGEFARRPEAPAATGTDEAEAVGHFSLGWYEDVYGARLYGWHRSDA